MTRKRNALFGLVLAALAAFAGPAAADTRTICTYDPAGKSGDYFKILEDLALQAESWGVTLEIKGYTDEETAAKDYEAGQCDGVVATGVRLQRFNRFPSTIEAIGALPTYRHLEQMIDALAKYEPKGLVSGEHETAGILPVGAVYLFVRDRNIDTVEELAGKRIATMDYDKAAPVMVDKVGAIMVPADLGSIGPKFNNGDVDACYVSAPAYKPFELERGLGSNGGVIRYPIAQATLQLLIRRDRFPEGFGSKARKFFADKFDEAIAIVKKAEAEIPERYWIDVGQSTEGFDDMFLNVRLELRDKHKAYDPAMLHTAAMIRCGIDPSRPECAEKKE
ncbi:MAG: hypothetical protein D6798_17965 [Deltaproteobacteria bacterium]|nr:MAG: hypothetical protein D6798_17965 [Deltaproteobacteria bacterium]